MIQGHGDDIFNYPDIKINFSSNVNPLGTSQELLEHLKKQASCISSYPKPLAENLAGQIADFRNLHKESVLVTHGAVEALYLIASLLSKKRSLIFVPSFSEYEDACKSFQHKIDFCLNENGFVNQSLSDYDAVWLANPNNPDGKIYDVDQLKNIIQEHKTTTFIIDEAYLDFTLDEPSLAHEIINLSNLVVICSLTKRFSVPGIRLGYLVTHPQRIEQITQNLMPWRINALAIECGLFCLSEHFNDDFNIKKIVNESKRVQREINNLPGFNVLPSETLFFLVEASLKASELKQELAFKNKLLIRDASNFRGLSDNHFRVSIRNPEQNEVLINALKEWK